MAGISGAAAVALQAFCTHVLAVTPSTEEQKTALDVANRYHLIHSVALLGVTLARRPGLTGALMIGGMVTFCGSNYFLAFFGDRRYRKLTSLGMWMLMAAWLSMLL